MKLKDYEIIDFEQKGNCVRFYLGKNGDQFGDDWDDAPYEDNAGTVYEKFVKATADVAFGMDTDVYSPGGYGTESFTKDGMKRRAYPCLSISLNDLWGYAEYTRSVMDSKSWNIFFGDVLTEDMLKKYHGTVIAMSEKESPKPSK